MFLSSKLATAVINAFEKGNDALAVSAFNHILNQRDEDDNAVALIYDLLGFCPKEPSSELVDFFDDLDDVLANAYSPSQGLGEGIRTEASEHRAAMTLKRLGCTRSWHLVLWRINTKWRSTEHFPHLNEIHAWSPPLDEFYRFSAQAGRWKARHSDFEAALSVYLRTGAMTICPFRHVDEVRINPLIHTLNTSEKNDQLTSDKLRVILEIYRRCAGLHYPDDFTFLHMLTEKHGLDKRVALQLEAVREDFLLYDLGL